MECAGGFSSPRTDAFPAGLRVLVVDDDPTWLKILEKMLKKCSYEVTTCGLAREALDVLRERRDGFDIVISDVNMPDMDGFKLLEHVGLEMDLPVIMMSVDGETSRVMMGVQHGACDYLLKPIRMKELKNIWQHVFRKRMHEVRDTDSHEGLEEIQLIRNGLHNKDDAFLFSEAGLSSGKKRKDVDNKHDDKEYSDASSMKKVRVVWTVDLHQKFVKAVDQIGLDKVGPKKILDLMGVPWLTRENVASHLQKYRLYLSRLHKENEQIASLGGVKHSVLCSRDPAEDVCIQNPQNMQLSDVTNDNFGMQDIDCRAHDKGVRGIASVPIVEAMKVPSGDTTDTNKTGNPKRVFNQSLQLPNSNVKNTATVPSHYPWTAECPQIQFKVEPNAHFYLENPFNQPLPRVQHHVEVDCRQPSPSFNYRPCDELAVVRVEPSQIKNRSQVITKASQSESDSNTVSIQPVSNLPNHYSLEPIPSPTRSIKSDCLDQVLLSDQESPEESLILGSGSASGSLDSDLLGDYLQGDSQPLNIGVDNLESFDYYDPELLVAMPPSLYEFLRPDHEYPFDSMEYPY